MSEEEKADWKTRDFDEEIKYRSYHIETDPQYIAAGVQFSFESARAVQAPFSVTGSYFVFYVLQPAALPNIPAEARTQFARVNGVFNAWPFMRELISNCSTRLGRRAALIPLYRPPAQLPPEGEFVGVRRPKRIKRSTPEAR
jgi:hypothetical protein